MFTFSLSVQSISANCFNPYSLVARQDTMTSDPILNQNNTISYFEENEKYILAYNDSVGCIAPTYAICYRAHVDDNAQLYHCYHGDQVKPVGLVGFSRQLPLVIIYQSLPLSFFVICNSHQCYLLRGSTRVCYAGKKLRKLKRISM